MNISELECGEDTDKKVSLAVGSRPSANWAPSTDWYDAMEAAREAKLFSTHVLGGGADGKPWAIIELSQCEDILVLLTEDVVFEADTGPLCICGAILKLEEARLMSEITHDDNRGS